MTEQHRAKPEVWARVESYGSKDEKDMLNCVLEHMLNCVLELRDRVEALEAAQQPTVEDSLTVPADSLASRQPWAAMSFRGAMLLPPPDCADPDFWIAERIYEMGVADGKNTTTGNTAPVTRDRAEDAPAPSHSLVERVAIVCAIPAKWTWDDQARAAILTVADWFEQQGSFTTAARLRMEVG